MFESGWLFLGWIVCTWLIASVFLGIHDALKEVNDDLESKLMKRINDIVHRVRVEKEGDVYYWYDLDDHEFLAQGSSDEEIIDLLKTGFPLALFGISSYLFFSLYEKIFLMNFRE